MLFNSRLKLVPRRLRSKWSSPFTIKDVKLYGAMELMDPSSADLKHSCIVNGQRVKVYNGGDIKRLTTIIELHEPCESFASS